MVKHSNEVEELRVAIHSAPIEAIKRLLAKGPALANAEIWWGENHKNASVPLHYACDASFNGWISREKSLAIVKLLLAHHADTEMVSTTGNDTPLIAAASLHLDQVAIELLRHGSDINFCGTHGATAMHWAAWTGSLEFVSFVLDNHPNRFDLEKRCSEFGATVFFWAIHGYVQAYLANPREANQRQQANTANLLKSKGADFRSTNHWHETTLDLFPNDVADPVKDWLVKLGVKRSQPKK